MSFENPQNNIQTAPEQAEPGPLPDIIDPDEFLTRHGIQDLAQLDIEAHGRIVSLRNGVACAPFAKMIEGMSDRLKGLALPEETKQEFFRGSIKDMAASTNDLAVQQRFEKKN